MNSSDSARGAVAQFPQKVVDEQTALFLSHAINQRENSAIQTLVQLTIPPPDVALVAEVIPILLTNELIDIDAYEVLSKFVLRNESNQELRQNVLQKEYPLCFAIKRLHRSGKDIPGYDNDAVRMLVFFAANYPRPEKFAGHMYYKHIIGFRDVCELYWNSLKGLGDDHYSGSKTFRERLLEFIRFCRTSYTVTDTLRSKLDSTHALLEDNLVLGGAAPRDGIDGRQQSGIGKPVIPSEALLTSLETTTHVHSAKVGEPWVDDDGVSISIDHPESSTVKDKQSVTRHVLSGFARTNVRTKADMAACSVITYSDFLIHARESLDAPEFSLVWLSAFTGLDVSRPLGIKRSKKHIPTNDEILFDKAQLQLEYNVLRRRLKTDPTAYETCGLMRLPIDPKVVAGNEQLIKSDLQLETIARANLAAKQFGGRSPGLTPTLRRLRASARIHFSPLGFTELEFAALSGRVPPKLLAISHYYPKSVTRIASKFLSVFSDAHEQLKLGAPTPPLQLPSTNRRNRLFCRLSAELSVVRELLNAIATAYSKARCEVYKDLHQISLEKFAVALNIHELSVYVCQELAVGLRPTGRVAQLGAASTDLGCMSADKGSRFFAERSFSPMSEVHWKLLSTSSVNRTEFSRILKHTGRPLIRDESPSCLACQLDPMKNSSGLILGRMSGQVFRTHALQLPGIYEIESANNWIRHVATEYVGDAVPRWQADEHFGHRQIGREPMGIWSTAGTSHFAAIRNRISELLIDIMPGDLLTPICTPDIGKVVHIPANIGKKIDRSMKTTLAQRTRNKPEKSRSIRSNSMLPASTHQFGKLTTLENWYARLWNNPSRRRENEEIQLLRAYCSLMIDSAIPHSAALDCLCSLYTNPSSDHSIVSIPVQRQDFTNRRTWLSVAPVTKLAVESWKATPDSTQHGFPLRPKRLTLKIETAIKKQFSQSIISFGLKGKLSYKDIRTLGPLIAIRYGAEPYLITALNGRVRPISQSSDDPYLLADVTQEPLSHFLTQHDGLTLRSEALRSVDATTSDDHESIPTEWNGRAKQLLRDLCSDLTQSVNLRVDSPRKSAIASRIFDSYTERAASLGPQDSALMLAVKYARVRFIEDATITAGSLRDYLDRAVISGLLDSENSYSLADWDTDDFIENLEDRLSGTRLSRRSKQQILVAYQPLLKFLTAELGIPPVSISGAKQDFVGGGGQWRLLSPHAVDKVIAQLSCNKSHALRQAAIVIALGYYCGLRSTEIRRLTLADIVYNDRLPDVDVELLRGKSANARRRIPLSKMAPKHIVCLLRDTWTGRRAEFDKTRNQSKISFLGPTNETDGYHYQSLTRLTRDLLKNAFGDSANIHLLRHCFCSNLFVRWYALRHPDILRNLRDRSHALFQPELQKELNTYFDCNPHDDGDIRPYDLLSMTKLTGHASPETMFQFYVHSFSFVQAHAVSRIRTPCHDMRLPDKALASLIPGLRSPSSRAKLQTRTIGEIAAARTKSKQSGRLSRI